MKFLISLFICYLLGSTLATSFEEDEENAKKECLNKYELTFGELNKAPVSKQKIVWKCITEKLGVIKDGIIQLDYIQQKSPVTALQIKYALIMCTNIGRGDPNDLAYELNECIYENDIDYFMKNCIGICSECREKVNLTDDEYATIQYLPVKNVTETMKLYAKCVLEEYGYLENNIIEEDVITDVFKGFLNEKLLNSFIRKCKALKGDNEMDRIYQLFRYIERVGNTYIPYLQDEYKMKQLACLEEKKLELNEVFSEQTPTQPTPTLKTFANCVFDKMGYIKDGILQPQVIYRIVERTKYTQDYFLNISKCINFEEIDQNVNNDMLAYNFGKCVDLFAGQQFIKDWEKTGSECEVESIFDEDFSNLNTKNPTPAMKYFASCVFKKLNFLKDNVLQKNFILEIIDIYTDSGYLHNFLNSCRKIKGKNHKETAFKLYKCMDNILYDYE